MASDSHTKDHGADGHDPAQAGGAGGAGGGSNKRRMEMPTFGTLWRIRLQVPHIGGHQVIPGREVTVSQLLIGFMVFMFVAWASGLLLSGPMRVMAALIAGGLAGMFVAKVDSGGRSVWRELQRMAAFSGKCRLYQGAARIGPEGSKKRKKRLQAMLAAEDAKVEPKQGVAGVVFEGVRDIANDLWDVYGPRKRGRPAGPGSEGPEDRREG